MEFILTSPGKSPAASLLGLCQHPVLQQWVQLLLSQTLVCLGATLSWPSTLYTSSLPCPPEACPHFLSGGPSLGPFPDWPLAPDQWWDGMALACPCPSTPMPTPPLLLATPLANLPLGQVRGALPTPDGTENGQNCLATYYLRRY